ncbi:MAG: putative dsRNA-binding protein, partial [Firmicutes bacterium]|nr:putative dsRNA-binding protein [Bacillota bacterium]
KTMLQEAIQKDHIGAVTYRVIGETGKDHNKTFEVEVLIDGVPKSKGVGKSKKDAEQHAAQLELSRIKNENI